MKSLVVYYTRTKTTEKVAHTISENMKCDIEEVSSQACLHYGELLDHDLLRQVTKWPVVLVNGKRRAKLRAETGMERTSHDH